MVCFGGFQSNDNAVCPLSAAGRARRRDRRKTPAYKTSCDSVQFFMTGCSRSSREQVYENRLQNFYDSLHLVLTSRGSPGLILCIGDSLTAGGYPTLLQGLFSVDSSLPVVVWLSTSIFRSEKAPCRRDPNLHALRAPFSYRLSGKTLGSVAHRSCLWLEDHVSHIPA